MLTWKQQVADMRTTKSCARQRSICNVESIGSISTPWKSVTYEKTNRHSQCILLTQRVFSFMFSPSIRITSLVQGPPAGLSVELSGGETITVFYTEINLV